MAAHSHHQDLLIVQRSDVLLSSLRFGFRFGLIPGGPLRSGAASVAATTIPPNSAGPKMAGLFWFGSFRFNFSGHFLNVIELFPTRKLPFLSLSFLNLNLPTSRAILSTSASL